MRRAFAAALTLVAAACAACDPGESALPPGDPATLGALRDVRDHACACKDPACAYRVLGELFAYADGHKQLRDTQASAQLADELGTCLDTASRAAPLMVAGPDGGAPRLTQPVTGMPACDEYLRVMEGYLACDQFPQAARDSTRASVDQMRQAWADMANLPPDVRRTAEDACKQATDAMRQAGQAMGCDLPPPPP
ncbi:MAG TPA: hypothetical protein VM261_08750 [Kofleriaceae bacterium]|nr:hypothetical protein [Kofleriaceae bacterium]